MSDKQAKRTQCSSYKFQTQLPQCDWPCPTSSVLVEQAGKQIRRSGTQCQGQIYRKPDWRCVDGSDISNNKTWPTATHVMRHLLLCSDFRGVCDYRFNLCTGCVGKSIELTGFERERTCCWQSILSQSRCTAPDHAMLKFLYSNSLGTCYQKFCRRT